MKHKLNFIRLICSIALISLTATNSQAGKKCEWWQDMFGLCTAGEKISESLEVAAARVGDSVHKTFDFWSNLIEKYHTGTPEEQKKAKELLNGVFGDFKTSSIANPFQLRIYVEGIDTANKILRVSVLRDNAQTVGNIEETIRKGSRTDFTPYIFQGIKVEGAPTDT